MPHTRKLLSILCRHCPQMPQVALISHKHNDNIAIRMIPQLLQPPRHILECLVLADIVNEERTHSAAVVCRGDGSVALLARRIPDLCLDGLCVNLDAAGCELDTDGRLGI
jgi:hypothetical protein